MAVSTNLGLYLPTREDYISVSRDLSNNYEIIDKSAGMLEKGIAIVVNGDTAPRAISSGDYLFIKNHSTLATGGYHATANIANGAAVTSSNTASDAKGVANTIKGDIDALNSKIIMPSETQVSTLDAIETHILSIHSSLSVGETTQDYLNVTIDYSGSYFTKQTRYWGTYAKINSVQGAATYRSRQGDEVVVGVNNATTTPVWNIDSVALNSKIANSTGGSSPIRYSKFGRVVYVVLTGIVSSSQIQLPAPSYGYLKQNVMYGNNIDGYIEYNNGAWQNNVGSVSSGYYGSFCYLSAD